MGRILDLEEGHPIEVHKGLIKLISHVFSDFRESGIQLFPEIQPGIQFNSRDFYFQEPEIMNEIIKLYTKEKRTETNPWATIHQANQVQPIKSCTTFIEELNNNIALHKRFGTKNLLIHLPVDKENRIDEICEILTSESVTEILSNAPVTIDLENNHHMSFFGNLEHCSNLFDTIKDRFFDIGKKEIYEKINFCFDSGHFFIDADKMGYPKEKMMQEFFELRRDKIKSLHLHSNDGKKDHHLLLGQIPLENSQYEVNSIDIDKLKQNTQLILDALPILKLKQSDNWNIVTEVGLPYNYEHLLKNFELIHKSI